ncbi:MAG: thiamine pyrophosphate-binding protein [Candidatus Rokubacteria bacterium]|nr:thiamine pyrophosphate-binding protein [Candidatus Rokubacteria bacterium]
MPFMAGKQAFLEILKQEGVEVLFGNPGTTELPLMDGLAREGQIRYVLALQEAVAIAMADGYAQASGKLAAVNVHISPGLGNAMGMLYDAYKAGTPLLLTAGQHDQSMTLTEPVLWSDLPPVARPYVKWSFEIHRLDELPRAVHRAAKVALTPPTGPVFLSLPVDVLNAEADLEPGEPTRVDARTRGSRDAVEQAAKLLAKAKRPILVAGDSVAQSGALAELQEVAELLGVPVYLEGMANRCAFPFTHPLYQGAIPRLAHQIRPLLREHDLLFSVGGDLFTFSLPSDVEPLPEGLSIIHLDVDPWELGKNYPARVAIVGEPKATLPDLAAALRQRFNGGRHPEAQRRLEQLRQKREQTIAELKARAQAESDRVPITPLALVNALAEALPAEAVVVDESISSGGGLRNLLRCQDPQSFFGLRGGGIGWGLPAAVGIKLALPGRPVVALVGDGSAMYTNQAFWTAARERLSIVFVIFNNRSYRILKQRVHALKGFAAQDDVYVGMDLENPLIDFVGLARSLGVPGERVEKCRDAGPALTRALAAGTPYLLEVQLDAGFKP